MQLNAGNLENKGYEIVLNVVPVKTKDITWALNINGARNINKVTKSGITTDYGYKEYLDGSAVIPGEALNTFYSCLLLKISKKPTVSPKRRCLLRFSPIRVPVYRILPVGSVRISRIRI